MIIPKTLKNKTRKPPLDFILLASILFLFGLGLVTLYSGTYNYAEASQSSGTHFIKKQALLGLVGGIIFILAILIKPEFFRNKGFILLILFAALVLNIAPILSGKEVNGATRWLFIGERPLFQPSELAKVILPFYLAHMLDRNYDRLDSFIHSVLPLFIVTFLFAGVIVGQNSFAVALFIIVNMLLIFVMSGVKWRYIIGFCVVGISIAFILILLKPHRFARFYFYFHKSEDLLGANHQVEQSIKTVISGGFEGKGLGQGTMKASSLAEIQSDFIFSSYAEEFGFLGVLLFLFLFALFAVQGYLASFRSESVFRKLLSFAYVTIIITQSLINLAVIIRVLPTTGIPLPFFSAGGSSLISSLGMCGIILNISRTPQPLEAWYRETD
jgi:cell division protein FtsW